MTPLPNYANSECKNCGNAIVWSSLHQYWFHPNWYDVQDTKCPDGEHRAEPRTEEGKHGDGDED